MRKVYVVADASSKNIRSVHILSSEQGIAGEIETCEQVFDPYVGEVETVQSVASEPGVKNIIIVGYNSGFLLLSDGSSFLLLTDGASRIIL